MTMTTHTPGPWHVDPAFPLSVMAPDGDEIPWLVANAMPDCGGTSAPGFSPEGEANARLIAAAPEMLDLLTKVAAIPCDTHRGIHCSMVPTGLIYPACMGCNARALLARIGAP